MPRLKVKNDSPKGTEVAKRATYLDEERLERAWRATKKFRAQLPTMNSFARALTRDPKVTVVLSTGTPRTDGRVIWMRPPIEFGDNLDHADRRLCLPFRDETFVPLCEACATEEHVLITLIHEISHIVQGSFDPIAPKDAAELIGRMAAEAVAAGASHVDPETIVVGENVKSYIGAAKVVNPFLGIILNAWEDAYVNRKTMEARPGTRAMFTHTTVSTFEQGIQDKDGVWHKWNENHRDMQVVIGLYCRASGYKTTAWFTDEVEAFLDTPEVAKLLFRFSTARSAKARYRLCFPTLEVLRAAGYCLQESDEPSVAMSAPGMPSIGEPGADGTPSGAGDGTGAIGVMVADDAATADDGPGTAVTVVLPSPEPTPKPTDEPDPGDTSSDADDDDTADEKSEEPFEDDTDLGKDPFDDDDDDESDDEPDDDDWLEDGDDYEGRGGSSPDEDAAKAGDDTHGEAAEDAPEGPEAPSESHDYSDPDEVSRGLEVFGGHAPASSDEESYNDRNEDRKDSNAIDVAISQGERFDTPSAVILDINIHKDIEVDRYYAPEPVEVSPGELNTALLQMRVAFADNAKAARQGNHKSGRVDARVLGRRVPVEDPRLFYKRREPGRRDYFVVIGMDISGSTSGRMVQHIKRAGLAQAELCHRMGIDFTAYAHTGQKSALELYEIKSPAEAWTDKTRAKLQALHARSANLDGHTLEFYRKLADQSTATDRLIMYYTDGAMPAENYYEELTILQREIKTCQQHGHILVGVAFNNDDPLKYGLDTILVRTRDDDVIPKVVKGLRDRLLVRAARAG